MSTTDRLERAGDSLDGREWGKAFALLSEAHREGELEGEDLERLAVAAYMVGEDDASTEAWMRAHQHWLGQGEPERAARCAFQQALGLFFRGDLAPAMGWVARAGRVLKDVGDDCVEHAWLAMLPALPVLFGGDAARAYPQFVAAGEIAERFGDRDATMFARLTQGHALIMQQRTGEGMALLDEVMVAVAADEVSPVLTGIAYCQVIALCNEVFDLRRAREWTEALSRWCDVQPDLVPYRGNCLVHRCQIFQVQGSWNEALEEAERACESLAGPPEWDTLGSAYYQLAEIQRLRGEHAKAEASYRKASQAGREPEPGLSLLRVAQGRTDVAVATMHRVLEEAQDPIERSKILPAYVEIMLEADDIAAAREAADELTRIAAQFDAPYLSTLAAQASGAVLLSEGDPQTAIGELRTAYNSWRTLDAPYLAARVRVLIGGACRALGDEGGADREFEAARATFEQLGATTDVKEVMGLLGEAAPPASGGLSPRESEVLELVAAGRTNRAIAAELFISQKTVARHVSNIFTKLGLSSRSEATAYAYKHGLVR